MFGFKGRVCQGQLVEIPSSTGIVGVGKKINKGKWSRAIEVKHGQRKAVKREAHVPSVNTCRKHLSHQAPCPCSEELD